MHKKRDVCEYAELEVKGSGTDNWAASLIFEVLHINVAYKWTKYSGYTEPTPLWENDRWHLWRGRCQRQPKEPETMMSR